MRRMVAVGCTLVLIATACSDATEATTTTASAPVESTTSSTTATSTSTTEPVPVAIIGDLPEGACGGIGTTPTSAEVSFLAGGQMYAAAPDGSGLRCVMDLAEDDPSRVLWGPAADTLYLSGAVFDAAGPVALDSSDVPSAQWTRPTGTSIISITNGGDSLTKSPLGGGDPVDVSFLERHDEVVYYPSGTHLAVVGENHAGEYGIHFATNLGNEARVMVVTDMAELSAPAFDHPGFFLYWIAVADGVSHVHEIFALDPVGAEQVSLEESIILESSRDLSNLLVSPFGSGPGAGDPPLIALSEGRCGDGVRTMTLDTPLPVGFDDVDNEPVGWLPDGRLVVAMFPAGCASASGDLYLISWDDGEPSVELLVAGVEAAAVRAPLPDPPPPPNDLLEGFT